MTHKITGLACAFLLTLPLAVTARTLVHAGRLIDGVNGSPRTNVTVVVDDGRFVSIVNGFVESETGDQIIDLSNNTVMPGLMDMHTHIHDQMSKQSYMEEFTLNPTDYAIRSTVYAHRTLMAGFTTIRNLGDDGLVSVSLREAIASGMIAGPRIYTAGKSIATTGGHADPTNGWAMRFRGDPGPRDGVINGPSDARKAVRQRYKDGADLIKVTGTGGVLSLGKSGENPQLTEEEFRAIVETANDYGMTVAVHAHGTEGMIRAVNAGVTSIEHGTYMTPEVMKLMKQHGTYYVPTIMAGDWVAEKSKEDGFFPDVVRPKAAKIGPVIRGTFAAAYKAGVKIAFGTDSGVSAHGDNWKEFVLMVDGGMPPMVAIQSATMEGAKLLRIDSELGSIEPGKIADLVAVDGNPLDDISVMGKMSFVMKAGEVFKRNGKPLR